MSAHPRSGTVMPLPPPHAPCASAVVAAAGARASAATAARFLASFIYPSIRCEGVPVMLPRPSAARGAEHVLSSIVFVASRRPDGQRGLIVLCSKHRRSTVHFLGTSH